MLGSATAQPSEKGGRDKVPKQPPGKVRPGVEGQATHLRSFLPSKAREPLFTWGAWGPRVASLAHRTSFSCGTLWGESGQPQILRGTRGNLPKSEDSPGHRGEGSPRGHNPPRCLAGVLLVKLREGGDQSKQVAVGGQLAAWPPCGLVFPTDAAGHGPRFPGCPGRRRALRRVPTLPAARGHAAQRLICSYVRRKHPRKQ